MIPAPAVQRQGLGAVSADQVNTFVQTIANLAQLRGFIGLTGMQVFLQGTTTEGDGGQGNYVYNASATAADNGTTVVRPTGLTTGAWLLVSAGAFTAPLWGGVIISAPNDGVTDATSALVAQAASAASSGQAMFLPAGTYLISGNVTFSTPLTFEYGAVIKGTSTAVVTISNGLYAPIVQIFNMSGSSTVSINGEFTPLGYPEWWGAVANTSGTDCAAPAMAAVRSGLKRVSFGPDDYWFNSTFIIDTPYVEVFGVNTWWSAAVTPGACTRLLANFATGPVVRLGTASAPGGGITYFQRNNWLHHLNIARAIGFTAPAIGSEASGPVGLVVQYCLDFWVNHVRCEGSSVGFVLTSNVDGYFYRCVGFQSAAAATITSNASFTGTVSGNTLTATSVTGTIGVGCRLVGASVTSGTVIIAQNSGPTGGAGTYALNLASTAGPETMTAPYDPFWGWFVNGANGIGATNGNASMYIQNCGATLGGNPTPWAIGMQYIEYLEDTYIRDFETYNLTIGINIIGAPNAPLGNLNVEIDHAVIDQFSLYGISITSTSTASINVVNSYAAPQPGASPSACFAVFSCSGAMTFSNNETVCVLNTSAGGGSCIGMLFSGSSGIASSNNRLMDSQRPQLVIGCTGSSFCDLIVNENNTASGAAMAVSGTNKYLYVRPIVRGKANAFTSGVNLNSTTTTLSECNMTGVNAGCISVAGAKLVYNAGNITSTGAFGTNNLASGVIA